VNVDLRHNPSFAAARIGLEPNEQVRAESGAMMASSYGVSIQASTQGGVLKGLKRSVLGGESLFITSFTAPASGGWVDVAHHLAGDIVVAGVTPNEPMLVTKGSWLASSAGIDLDTKWGGFKNLFGGEGGFLVRATGHVVAFGETVSSQIRKVAGGVIQTIKSGEGLVFDFTGPGWVMTQTRNPAALEAWIRQIVPTDTGGGGVALGGILGR